MSGLQWAERAKLAALSFVPSARRERGWWAPMQAHLPTLDPALGQVWGTLTLPGPPCLIITLPMRFVLRIPQLAAHLLPQRCWVVGQDASSGHSG